MSYNSISLTDSIKPSLLFSFLRCSPSNDFFVQKLLLLRKKIGYFKS